MPLALKAGFLKLRIFHSGHDCTTNTLKNSQLLSNQKWLFLFWDNYSTWIHFRLTFSLVLDVFQFHFGLGSRWRHLLFFRDYDDTCHFHYASTISAFHTYFRDWIRKKLKSRWDSNPQAWIPCERSSSGPWHPLNTFSLV